ncbi:MAG TPA: zinc-ribbon domain-containing protein [Syntrophomonadaceae bacterium]|nr:zinc-ribbon domain-containing protein [Syntrophomonadaceae bacterium]
MFCPKCGSEQSEDAVFCTNCGEKIGEKIASDLESPENEMGERPGGLKTPAAASSPSPSRKLILSIAAALVVIIVGFYVFTAFIPPSLAKSIKSLDKLGSYKQELVVSIPYESQFNMSSETDKKLGRTHSRMKYEGETYDIYNEPGRMIIGLEDYHSYAAINWEQSNDKLMSEYVNSIEKDLAQITKVVKNEIIKPKADTSFKRETIRTPDGNSIKVKQYQLKLVGNTLADIWIDIGNRVDTDAGFRDNIYSIINKSIDFIEDTYGDAIKENSYEDFDIIRSEAIASIDEMGELLADADNLEYLREDLKRISLDTTISYDSKNRPVEFYFSLGTPDGSMKIKNTIYGFNQPVNIHFPDEMDITDIITLNDLFWIFY